MRTLLALIIIFLTACSAANTKQFIYDSAQHNAMKDCEQHVDSHSRDCREEYSETFEEYKEAREELLKSKK